MLFWCTLCFILFVFNLDAGLLIPDSTELHLVTLIFKHMAPNSWKINTDSSMFTWTTESLKNYSYNSKHFRYITQTNTNDGHLVPSYTHQDFKPSIYHHIPTYVTTIYDKKTHKIILILMPCHKPSSQYNQSQFFYRYVETC